MANTPANIQTASRPKAVVYEGFLINTDEVLFAKNTTSYATVTPGSIATEVAGCQIEFIRKGVLFVPGLTVEGLGNLMNGDPF